MMGDGGFAVASKIKLDLEVSEVLAHNARRLHTTVAGKHCTVVSFLSSRLYSLERLRVA
jgi:hypothetical protein